MKKFKGIGLSLLLVLLIMATGSADLFQISKSMDIFSNLYREVNKSYVDDVEAAGLMREALRGMLKELDPYTNYISEAQIEDARIQRSGMVGDVGIDLLDIDGKPVVFDIVKDLSADSVGIKNGDIIVSIDRKTVAERSVEDIKLAFKGKPGSTVEVAYFSLNDQLEKVAYLQRKEIESKDVTYSKLLEGGIGYVKLTSFTRNCGKFVEEEIDDLISQGAEELVFDLRNNGGGLLMEAIYICNLFLPKGSLVVSTKGKLEEWNKTYDARMEPRFPDIPMAILINSKSASASEIVSGVMQDYDRALVVGKRSFGKGLVQQTRDIGYNSKLKLTVAKYFLPSGRCIQAVDYYGQYTDDGAQEIPDSVKVAFATTSGRTVYDASGVLPDIVLESKTDTIVAQLVQEHLFFQFANQMNFSKPATASEVNIPDSITDEFVLYLKSINYQYPSETLELVKQLKDVNNEEDGALISTLEEIENKIHKSFYDSAMSLNAEISEKIKVNLIKRYFYSSGVTDVFLFEDPNIEEAKKIIQSEQEMNRILNHI